MKLPQTTITFSTSVTKDSAAISTTLTLSESEIDEATFVAALLSGSSPRVSWQAKARQNGVPTEQTISWADFITPKRTPRITQKPTPAQVYELAKGLTKDELQKLIAESMAREAAQAK